jgi:hypothetical protein
VCPICSDKEVEIDFYFLISNLDRVFDGSAGGNFEPSFIFSEISAGELVIKEEFNIRHGLQFV